MHLRGSGADPIFYFLKLIHQHITEEQININQSVILVLETPIVKDLLKVESFDKE
jgi:hypothetical protein